MGRAYPTHTVGAIKSDAVIVSPQTYCCTVSVLLGSSILERPSATKIDDIKTNAARMELAFVRKPSREDGAAPGLFSTCPDSYGMDPIPIKDSCEANITAYTTDGTQLQSYGLNPFFLVCPIANTYMYEVEPMPDSHSYQSNVWSETYGTQLRSTPQQKAMGLTLCPVPHSKHL